MIYCAIIFFINWKCEISHAHYCETKNQENHFIVSNYFFFWNLDKFNYLDKTFGTMISQNVFFDTIFWSS